MALNLGHLAEPRPWAAELIVAGIGLMLGAILMPVLIFYAGVAALGRFDGASLGHLYSSLFAGLREASIASWVVLLGPYGLYLLLRALRAWWRASVRLD
jgi:fumarate reductase subunit D